MELCWIFFVFTQFVYSWKYYQSEEWQLVRKLVKYSYDILLINGQICDDVLSDDILFSFDLDIGMEIKYYAIDNTSYKYGTIVDMIADYNL